MAIKARLQQPLDSASLAAFRIGFGALMLVAVLRYFTHGWIAEYFLQPTHFLKYWGFGWVKPWPGPLMYLHFGAMGLSALGIALGYRYRLSVVAFGLLFAYQHLIDKTNYLNHYYLIGCVCLLLALLPLGARFSLDARRRPELVRRRVPAWMLWALRVQFGVVYFFGGVAKLNSDWLLRAEPLSSWLARSADLPVLGPVLALPWMPYAMSWAGALFDLSVVPLLLGRRTRPFAYAALVCFHLLTARLFAIGMFPYVMLCGSLLFLPPDWPELLRARLARALPGLVFLPLGATERGLGDGGAGRARFAQGRLVPAVLALHLGLQLLLPLRHWAYPGSVLWTEQGFRFSWSVMLMEKDGSVDYRVVEPSTGRTFQVSPRRYFTPYQTAMMAPQPDMVLQGARVVAADFRARGVQNPAVYADAFAALNGRPLARLIDPHVDLASELDGLRNKPWILPMPDSDSLSASLLARSTP